MLECHGLPATLLGRDQSRGSFDLPRPAAVEAARQPRLFGLVGTHLVVIGRALLVISLAEADQDFVAPRPDPVIRGPPAVASRFAIHDYMVGGSRRERGDQKDGEPHSKNRPRSFSTVNPGLRMKAISSPSRLRIASTAALTS